MQWAWTATFAGGSAGATVTGPVGAVTISLGGVLVPPLLGAVSVGAGVGTTGSAGAAPVS